MWWYVLISILVVVLLYLVLRTPKFWKQLDNILRDPSRYELEEPEHKPDTSFARHLRYGRENIFYFWDRDAGVVTEILRVNEDDALVFAVYYEDNRIVSFTKAGRRPVGPSDLASWQHSRLRDLRDRARKRAQQWKEAAYP